MKKKLNTFIADAIENLNNAQSKLLEHDIKSILIDKEYFDEKFMKINITEATEDFKLLKTIKEPVLYWYELNSSENNIIIREKYTAYRGLTKISNNNVEYRNTSSLKTKPDYNTKTLYVGKVETSFWGRLVTHLGYNKSEKTAGMQLFHWYNPALYGSIKLNYIEFDNDMKHLIIILEKQLAKELKPLIGRY
jgi:hypothetical protein